MIQRILLTAEKGRVLTDGTHYCKEVYLAENESAEKWYEITDIEYNRIMESEE